MMKCFFVAVLYTLLVVTHSRVENSTLSIQEEDDTSRIFMHINSETLSSVVAIIHNNSQLCGGALLTMKHALVAAICVYQYRLPPFDNLTVVVGAFHSNHRTPHPIEHMHISEEFTNAEPAFCPEVAVLTLKEEACQSEYVSVIRMSREIILDQMDAVLVGFKEDLSTDVEYINHVRSTYYLYTTSHSNEEGVYNYVIGNLLVRNERLIGIALRTQNGIAGLRRDVIISGIYDRFIRIYGILWYIRNGLPADYEI